MTSFWALSSFVWIFDCCKQTLKWLLHLPTYGLHVFISNVDFPISHNPDYIQEIDDWGVIWGPDQGDLVQIGSCSIQKIDAQDIDGLG